MDLLIRDLDDLSRPEEVLILFQLHCLYCLMNSETLHVFLLAQSRNFLLATSEAILLAMLNRFMGKSGVDGYALKFMGTIKALLSPGDLEGFRGSGGGDLGERRLIRGLKR